MFLLNVTAIKAAAPGWSVNPALFSNNGEVTTQVFMNSTAVTSGTLGAFVGDECRGVVDASFFPPGNYFLFTVMCFSNQASGETLTFKYSENDSIYYRGF